MFNLIMGPFSWRMFGRVKAAVCIFDKVGNEGACFRVTVPIACEIMCIYIYMYALSYIHHPHSTPSFPGP